MKIPFAIIDLGFIRHPLTFGPGQGPEIVIDKILNLKVPEGLGFTHRTNLP